MWSEKVALLGLIMKYGKWGGYWIKNSENWTVQVQVTPCLTLTCVFWPLTFISHSKVYQICVLGQSSYPEQGNTAFNLTLLSTTHFKCKRKPYSIYNPRSLFYFSFNHLCVIYLTFICLTTNLVEFIDSVAVILSYLVIYNV